MKKTGKALSLVLSLALVVSSLATTFASAASTSESGTASVTQDTVYLSNGGKSADGTLTADMLQYLQPGHNGVAVKLYDGAACTNFTLKDVVVTSGSSIASISTHKDTNSDIDKADLKLTSGTVTGAVTVAARYQGSVYRGTSSTATTVYASKNITVNVLKKGQTYILSAGGAANGSKPLALSSLSKNLNSTVTGAVYTVGTVPATSSTATDGSALASWTPVDVTAYQPATGSTVDPSKVDATLTQATNNVTTPEYYVTVGSNNYVNITTGTKSFTLTTKTPVGTNGNTDYSTRYATTTSFNVSAQQYNATANDATKTSYKVVASNQPTDKASVTDKIANRVELNANNNTISAYGGITYAYSSEIASSDDLKHAKAVTTTTANGLQVVSGCDVVINSATGATPAATSIDSGSVGVVTAKDGTGATATLTVSSGSVGAIDDSQISSVTVSKGTVGSVGDNPFNRMPSVTVNGGTVGNIYANSVTVESNNEVAATVGNVTLDGASPVLTLTSHDSYPVKAGTVSASDDSTIALLGNTVTVGQIDANYKNVIINMTGFKGSIAAPAHAYTQGIDGNSKGITVNANEQSTGDMVANITGTATIPTLNVVSGTVNFPNSVKIGAGGITGAGTVCVVPGNLYTDGSITGVNLRLSTSFKVGDTAFTAATGVVDPSSFTPVGYTLAQTTGNPKDTFKVATTNFAGLQISGPATLTKGTSATYTASAYPGGTSLPTGDTIGWDFSGNQDNFDFTINGNAIKVTAKTYDSTFASQNHATLTAKVLDASGAEDTTYPQATYDVAIVTAGKYTSDTTSALTLKVGQQYTYKITSTDGSDPAFGFGTNGVAKIVKTSKAVSGTTTFYYYTVQGVKEGATGAYNTADKTQVNVITVKGTAYKSDTSKVTIATGKSYTFKITADKGVSAPVFQVCTFSAKNTVLTKTVKNADGTTSYLYKVTANGSPVGNHGAYVNGLNVALVTVVK